VKLNRDIELLKIQVYADYCHTTFTFRTSVLVSGFVGLLLVILGLTYQGLMLLYVYYLTSAATLIVFYANLATVFRNYHNSLDQIQAFMNQLEIGESLPALREMRKTKHKA
jgi:hypothetical protein